ncbi:hypothetical protein ACFLR4_03940 [Bacteroidota bacterium]
MQSEEKLLEEFELEMWLYIEESLPEDRMKFWSGHLNNSPELKQMLDDSLKVLSLYDESAVNELSDPVYNEMIEKATLKPANIFELIKNKFENIFTPAFNSYRLAFGAAIIIVFIVVTSIIEKQNGNGIDINSSLDWKGNALTSQLDKMDNSINSIKSDNSLEYQMYRFTKDKFDVAIQSIGDRIDKLRNNMKKKSL